MGSGSTVLSEERLLPGACFTSPSVKVVVTPLAASTCMDVPLASLASQSAVDQGCTNHLAPMQIFLNKMAEPACVDAPPRPLSSQLDTDLSSRDPVEVLNGTDGNLENQGWTLMQVEFEYGVMH